MLAKKHTHTHKGLVDMGAWQGQMDDMRHAVTTARSMDDFEAEEEAWAVMATVIAKLQ